MGKNERLFLKTMLILAGMLIIGYILAISIRMNRIPQPEGEYIRLQDAVILTEFLEEDFDAVYGSDERYIGWKETLEADRDSLLTYGQFSEWLDMTQARMSGAQEAEEWGKKYRKEYFVLKEDWYACYEDVLEKKGMGDTIVLDDITVLGIGSQVSDREQNVLPENRLLAREGVFAFHSDVFGDSGYQVLRVYRNG